MKKVYGKKMALLPLMEVQWNSAQVMMGSLLQVKSAIRTFHNRYNSPDPDTFPAEFEPLGDNNFWKKMAIVEKVMLPLTKASFCMQKNNINFSDVLIVYGRMYRCFWLDKTHGNHFVDLIEKRFKKEEIPLLLLV